MTYDYCLLHTAFYHTNSLWIIASQHHVFHVYPVLCTVVNTIFVCMWDRLTQDGTTNFYKESIEFVCDRIFIICYGTIYLKFCVNGCIFPFGYYCFYYLARLVLIYTCIPIIYHGIFSLCWSNQLVLFVPDLYGLCFRKPIFHSIIYASLL